MKPDSFVINTVEIETSGMLLDEVLHSPNTETGFAAPVGQIWVPSQSVGWFGCQPVKPWLRRFEYEGILFDIEPSVSFRHFMRLSSYAKKGYLRVFQTEKRSVLRYRNRNKCNVIGRTVAVEKEPKAQ